jgi:hypothetical protein
VFEKIQTGSVLTIENGATILNSKNCIILTLPSAKYSKIQVYNPEEVSEAPNAADDAQSEDTMFKEDFTSGADLADGADFAESPGKVLLDHEKTLTSFCSDLTETQIVESLLKNISTIPLKIV